MKASGGCCKAALFMRRGIAVLGVEGLGCRGGVKTHSLATCIPILAVGGCNGMKLPGIRV